MLYACNEVCDYGGVDGCGGVSAFAVEPGASGGLALRLVGSASLESGAAPCMATVDRSASALLVAAYMGGSVSIVSLNQVTGIPGPVSLYKHAMVPGGGLDKQRQEAAHAHSVVLDAAQVPRCSAS